MVTKMSEIEFKDKLQKKLQERLQEYEVVKNENLIYRVIVDENLKFEPNNPKRPKRGNYAFQTDLLIREKENGTPLVVIETKYRGFLLMMSSHILQRL